MSMFNQKSKRVGKAIFVLVAMACVFSAGMLFSNKGELMTNLSSKQVEYTGQVLNKYNIGSKNYNQDIDFNLFWQVWDLLQREYVNRNELNEKDMFYGALMGLTASLEDPYTVFMDPKIADDFDDDLAGTFEGIGAEIGIKNNVLTIIAPLDGMPAQKAGILSGDKIYAIDGEITADITVNEAVKKIKGPRGTKVVLTIVHDGSEIVEDITITRNVIQVESVKTFTREDGLFVVKITNFNGDTYRGFNRAVMEILNVTPVGIIVN